MKLSLKRKVVLVIVLFTFVLSVCSVLLSYLTYINSFEDYYESLASSIAKSTATVVNKQQVEAVAEEVVKTYRRVYEEGSLVPERDSYTQKELEGYYAEFDYITEMPEYQELLQLLSRLREDHAVVSLYLGYHELDTMRDLYLVDSSAGESCLPGDYDDVEADQVEQLRAGNYDMPAYITNYPDYGWLCSASAAIENENGEISVSALFIKPLEIFRGRNIGINDIVIIGCNKRITV